MTRPASGVPARLEALGDERLAALAVAGDERALNALLARHRPRVVTHCRRYLREEADVDDAAQATLVAAARALPDRQSGAPVLPWLLVIARNESIDALRRTARRRAGELTEELPGGRTPDDEVATAEGVREVLADIEALPERQRRALLLRTLDHAPYGAIAHDLGTTALVARKLVHKARRGLVEARAGRELACTQVREIVAGSDRRRLRGRAVAAHLRCCPGCAEAAGRGHGHRRLAWWPFGPPLAAWGGSVTLGGAAKPLIAATACCLVLGPALPAGPARPAPTEQPPRTAAPRAAAPTPERDDAPPRPRLRRPAARALEAPPDRPRPAAPRRDPARPRLAGTIQPLTVRREQAQPSSGRAPDGRLVHWDRLDRRTQDDMRRVVVARCLDGSAADARSCYLDVRRTYQPGDGASAPPPRPRHSAPRSSPTPTPTPTPAPTTTPAPEPDAAPAQPPPRE